MGLGQRANEVGVFLDEWPDIQMVGFEPNPKCLQHIASNYPGVIHELALSDFDGGGTLHTRPRHADGASLFEVEGAEGSVDVPVRRMDTLYNGGLVGGDCNRMLWLDCEGCELAVLSGMGDLFDGFQMVNVELTSKPTSPDWCSSSEVHQWLKDHGMYRIWVHTQRSCAGQCDGIYVRKELFRPEFCCCPCEVDRWSESQ